LDHLY